MLPVRPTLADFSEAHSLTPAEGRIVSMVVSGCDNKSIATANKTTEQVAKNMLRTIYRKLKIPGGTNQKRIKLLLGSQQWIREETRLRTLAKMLSIFLFLILAGRAQAQHRVVLNWTAPATNSSWTTACGSGAGYDCIYKIYRTASSSCPSALSSFTYLASSVANTTTYTDTSVTNGTSYCYVVTTTQSAYSNESAPSNSVLASIPASGGTCGDPTQNGPNYSNTYTCSGSTCTSSFGSTSFPLAIGFTSPTAGCSMHFTSDGSAPSCSSSAFYPGSGWSLSSSGTFTYRVIACQNTYTPSNIIGGGWVINLTGLPTPSLLGGQSIIAGIL